MHIIYLRKKIHTPGSTASLINAIIPTEEKHFRTETILLLYTL
jgi:hypothetical protein